MHVLTLEEARSFYNKFGAKQDNQTFYEAPALKTLIANGRFDQATSVFEFGCGTGRFALELLSHHLPSKAQYHGVDISTTMIQLAAERLAPFASRATVTLAPGEVTIQAGDHSIDRFVSTYVLDLLSSDTAEQVFHEAHRVLMTNGLLCFAGITNGTTPVSRIVMSLWEWLYSRRPSLVGGCRPTQLLDHISSSEWHVQFHTDVVAWGIASEILIASPIKDG